MTITTRIAALQEYFRLTKRPTTNQELINLRWNDPEEFDKLARDAAKVLGLELAPKQN